MEESHKELVFYSKTNFYAFYPINKFVYVKIGVKEVVFDGKMILYDTNG